MIEETTVEVPCRIGELETPRDVFIKIIIPGNGIAAWVPASRLTILEQPIIRDKLASWGSSGLRGKVRARLLDKNETRMTVEIRDRGLGRIIDIPYAYFHKHSVEWGIPLKHFSPLIPLKEGRPLHG